MARPWVLAAGVLFALAGRAAAGGKTSKVTIETDPPGAKVYFNLKEDGEVCTTPCTVDAPIGETPIIVEAENRRSIIENLVVPRKTARPMRVSYKLKPALGALVIDGGDGAAILIDEQIQGNAPRRFDDIAAGAHHVVLEKNGKKLYDAFIEVEIDGEAIVSPPRVAAAEVAPARSEADAVDAGAVAAAREPPEPPRSSPIVAVSAATDIGFRQFTFSYRNPTDLATEHNDREGAQVLTGALVELWPATLLRLGALPGLAVYGRFQVGVNPQQVTMQSKTSGTLPTSLSTSWRSFELSVRQRWTIADAGTIEVGTGYVDDRYEFDSDDPVNGPAQRDSVPDVAYKAVRIGGRASLLLGAIEPYVVAENRLVLSGGALGGRYKLGSSVNGVRAALGAAVHLGRFEVRAEGSFSDYSWSFRHDIGDPDQAETGSDTIEQIGFTIGYAY